MLGMVLEGHGGGHEGDTVSDPIDGLSLPGREG